MVYVGDEILDYENPYWDMTKVLKDDLHEEDTI